MCLILVTLLMAVAIADQVPNFSKEITDRLEGCDSVLWVSELKKPVHSTIPIT